MIVCLKPNFLPTVTGNFLHFPQLIHVELLMLGVQGTLTPNITQGRTKRGPSGLLCPSSQAAPARYLSGLCYVWLTGANMINPYCVLFYLHAFFFLYFILICKVLAGKCLHFSCSRQDDSFPRDVYASFIRKKRSGGKKKSLGITFRHPLPSPL